MRPSRADTSEPACVKRKMLSMNSSMSWPGRSRKYSAIVSAESATRRRAPGGSFIWPKTMAIFDAVLGVVVDLGLASLHFQPEVVALAGPLADAGEHRVAAVRLGDAGDQLLDDDRLADARRRRRGRSCRRVRNGGKRSMTLMPVSKISGLGRLLLERRGVAVDRAAAPRPSPGRGSSIGSPRG